MGLLRADLQSLGNVLRQRPARRLLIGHVVALSILAVMSFLIGRATLRYPEVWAMARGAEVTTREVLATALMPCALVTGWLGLGLAQRLMFESPELPLWRSAPTGPLRGPMMVLLRVLFVTLLWAAAMVGPFAGQVLSGAGAPPLAYALLPLAMLLVVVPLLCPIMAVQMVLQRYFAGPVLQLVFTALTALGSLLFSLFLLVGALAPKPAQVASLSELAAERQGMPWNVDAAAHLLLNLPTGAPLDLPLVWRALGWALGAVLLFLLLTPLHPRAVEAHDRAHKPLFQRKLARSWPAAVAASIRRKELAQLLQQPSQLFSMAMFGVMVFVLASKGFVGSLLHSGVVPATVRQCGAMLMLWFLAVLLVLGAHMGRIALWDGGQWPLYLAAPVRPRAILLGKLQAIALLLLWPVLAVALAGASVLQASGTALILFVLLGLIGNFLALGVVAVVGTLPRVIRTDRGGQIEQGSRSLLAALLLIVGFDVVAMMPGYLAWMQLVYWGQQGQMLTDGEVLAVAPWVVLAALAYSLVIGSAGIWLGGRNFARLLRPR